MSLSIALKEWASVCRALESGRQIILLRKGGIYESAGEFEVEHRRFLLFPTYLHQSPKMLKPEAHAAFEARSEEPKHVELRSWAEVTDVVQLQSRGQMEAIEDRHIWTAPLVEMRFNYRPENPLYLLLVRAHVLRRPVTIENTIAYAGCKSWVPLEETIDLADSTPALDDAAYGQQKREILARAGGSA